MAMAISADDSAAECDYFTDVVADRKHDPIAKPRVRFGRVCIVVFRFHETAFQQFLAGIFLPASPVAKRIPVVRRIADFPRGGGLAPDAAALQIVARMLRCFAI